LALIGTLLKNRRAGEKNLAWNLSALAGPAGITLSSAAFEHEGEIPLANAGKRAGGQNQSPGLSWIGVPDGTVQLLLFVHCVALLEAGLSELPAGGLNKTSEATGVRTLRSGMGRGYLGPEPIKGHGPHRYVFQLFALATAVSAGEAAKPKAVLATVRGPVLARGRLDGFFTR
jgi:phosphatidylethanolamine-binding protein (PEBP) family uncharacterized protein